MQRPTYLAHTERDSTAGGTMPGSRILPVTAERTSFVPPIDDFLTIHTLSARLQ